VVQRSVKKADSLQRYRLSATEGKQSRQVTQLAREAHLGLEKRSPSSKEGDGNVKALDGQQVTDDKASISQQRKRRRRPPQAKACFEVERNNKPPVTFYHGGGVPWQPQGNVLGCTGGIGGDSSMGVEWVEGPQLCVDSTAIPGSMGW
jgi:hypothetical protein